MNRNDEFMKLKEELEQTPFELQYTAAKAIARAKKKKKLNSLWRTPLISFATFALSFVLLVNLFPAVALAMSNVPVLKELVKAVSLDPSLKQAVENDYYQVIGDSQTQEDVTASVDYMILDAGHVSLFFHVDAPVKAGTYDFDFKDSKGNGLRAGISFDTMYETGKMEEIEIELVEEDYKLPEEFTFELTVNKNPDFKEWNEASMIVPTDGSSPTITEEPISKGKDYTFKFLLRPDKGFSQTVDKYPISQWIDFKGQRIYLDRLEIYPTQAKLFIDHDEANSAIIDNVDINFKDNKGRVYGNKSNGCTGSFFPDSNDMRSLYYESSYFNKAKQLTLYINGIALIDKDKLYGTIDYSTKSISNLPEGVTVENMELLGSDLSITLRAHYDKPNFIDELFNSLYYDNSGNEYHLDGCSSSFNSELDESTYTSNFSIKNYEENKYKINWVYAPMQYFKEPMAVKIK